MQVRPQRLLDYREYPVLYVDDEPENLRIFELGFRRDFHVVTAESGERGLEILNERPVAVVLSDHKMPGMTGVDFLSRARGLDPKAIRILVTAYGDADTLSGAINDGSIYRYIAKPWRPEDLRLAVKRAIEVYALDREREELLRELTILNRVAQTINRELEIRPLLDLLLGSVVDELGFDGAAVLLFDEAGKSLRLERCAPLGPVASDLEGFEIPLAKAPEFARRLRAGESQTLSIEQSIGYSPPIRHWVTEVAAEEILVVPLVGKTEVLGALAVDNRRGGASFQAAERLLVDGFATQAAIAIANAPRVEALRHSRSHVVRADRLGTVGTLAAGIAHEINNPLVSIQTFLSLAPEKRDEQDGDFWGDYHKLALSEVDRIRGLVATMGRLARDGGEQATPALCSLGPIVEEVVRLVAHEAQEAEVSVDAEVDLDTPKVLVVREQLHQVMLNLILNAIHATPEGGRVTLRIWGDDEAACIEVHDTGCGIPDEHLERIFDPFFTTKGPDHGTGLGLMICHRIVTDHGGSIEVESGGSSGSTFRVRLPRDGGHRPVDPTLDG
jgi:two-component system NtrC family sensor kinase